MVTAWPPFKKPQELKWMASGRLPLPNHTVTGGKKGERVCRLKITTRMRGRLLKAEDECVLGVTGFYLWAHCSEHPSKSTWRFTLTGTIWDVTEVLRGLDRWIFVVWSSNFAPQKHLAPQNPANESSFHHISGETLFCFITFLLRGLIFLPHQVQLNQQ